MKIQIKAGLTLMAFSALGLTTALSCKPALQESSLAVTMAPKPTTALPVDNKSCKGSADGTNDLPAPSFAFNTFQYQWNGTNFYKMAYVDITIKSGLLQGGKYQCIITGDELTAVLGVAQAPGINGGDTTSYKSNCGIRCGGLNILDTVSSAYLVGTAKIVGTETDADGNAEPVVTEVDVAVQYTRP